MARKRRRSEEDHLFVHFLYLGVAAIFVIGLAFLAIPGTITPEFIAPVSSVSGFTPDLLEDAPFEGTIELGGVMEINRLDAPTHPFMIIKYRNDGIIVLNSFATDSVGRRVTTSLGSFDVSTFYSDLPTIKYRIERDGKLWIASEQEFSLVGNIIQ